jgi:hypothetical protein
VDFRSRNETSGFDGSGRWSGENPLGAWWSWEGVPRGFALAVWDKMGPLIWRGRVGIGYDLQAVIAEGEALRGVAPDLPAVRPASIGQGLSLMPMTRTCVDATVVRLGEPA